MFSLGILSLTHTHLSLVVPLGAQCVHMACGAQVRPLRNFLFKLMDSHLPPDLDLEASRALEIGQSVLLPPVLDRMDLLLAALPENPSDFASLTAGQCRQVEILLAGFKNRNEMVAIIGNEDMLFKRKDRKSWTASTVRLSKLYTLVFRMTAYLEHSIIVSLKEEKPSHEYLTPGSSLLSSFEEFILCFFIHIMSLVSTTISWTVTDTTQEEVETLLPHLKVFTRLLDEYCLPLMTRVASTARESPDPVDFLNRHQNILTGFLLNELPAHMALVSCHVYIIEYVCSIATAFLKLARMVHSVISILPPETVDSFEREELDWEPRNLKPEGFPLTRLREKEGEPWRKVMDLERALCFSSAKVNSIVFMGNMMTRGRSSEHDSLMYGVAKGKMKLLECGVLNSGGVGGNEEIMEAMNQWASLCKALPGTTDGLSPWTKCNVDFEAVKAKPTGMPFVRLVNSVMWEDVVPTDVKTAPPLFALALGCGGRSEVETLYQDMLDFARHKDWNTSFDEDTVPQLRQVSCAALACLLKHTGLFNYARSTPRAEAKKSFHDVYRCVFMLRRDVFTNRPLPPTSSGQVDEEELKKFTDTCTGICATLFFLMVILNPAIPEESDRIVPQIPSSKASPGSSSSTDDIGMRSPGAKTKFRTRPAGKRIPSDSTIPKQIEGSPMDIIHIVSPTRTNSGPESPGAAWSLSSVKVALSHLHWQREKVLRSDTPLHLKLGSTLMEVVGGAFHLQEDHLFNRTRMVKALLSQQKRGAHRVDGLERIVSFIDEDASLLLTSSKLIFLTECIPHHVHYSRDIMASPSIIQHQVKTLYHRIVQRILEETFHTQPDDLRDTKAVIGKQRRLLLALQWINFPADTDDLLLLFSLDIYWKLVVLCGLVSTKIEDDVVLPDSQLTLRTNLSSLFQLENVALRTGQNADVLKFHPQILTNISNHLFGVMEGFVNTSDPVVSERWKKRGVSVEAMEMKLGRFLCFLNTLSSTHSTIRAVLAEDGWFTSLVKIVNIDTTTGFPHVASLKTRLLALQVLGTIMNELTDKSAETTDKCAKTIDDLMDLMQRCMFLAPLSNFQHSLSSDESSTPVKQVTLPFRADASHQNNCTVVVEGQGVVAQGSGANSYVQGLIPLTSGKHTWKVSVESETAMFCVGVAHKPLFHDNGSPAFWALEAHTGRLLHAGDTTEALFIVKEKDSVMVEYDARARTLAFGKNDEPLRKGFESIGKEGEDLFPFVLFDRRTSCRVMIHPITHSSHSLLAHVKRREQDTSGYPNLSPVGVTLVHAIINIIYDIQDKEPWNKAISQVVYSRLCEMDVFMQQLADIRASLDSSSSSRTAGTDSLLPQLASVLRNLQQVVWPVLTVLGGLDSGYCLGRDCQKYEEKETKMGTIVSVPDGEKKVEVQEQITSTTAQVVRRLTRLKDLQLPVQSRFSLSLIFDKLTPTILMNITRIAGYGDDTQNHFKTIMHQIHSKMHFIPTTPHHSLPYQQLCESHIQVAAAKSLQGILFNESMIKLLDYRTPLKDTTRASGGGGDKSSLAVAVREILMCLVARAIKPSPLKVALRPMEMERIFSIVSYECLGAVSEYMSSSGHRRPQLTSQQIEATIPAPAPEHLVTRPDTLPPERLHFNYFEEDFLDAYFARNATPTYIHNMMDMGFSRAQINLALDRVEFPTHITDHGRMNMLVTWIVDHHQAAQEEDARARREQEEQNREEERQKRLEEQKKKMEADQNVAATQFLSLFGEMIDAEGEGEDFEMKAVVKRDTSHAPDLLEGPSINHNLPDMGIQGLEASREALQSLLSALGLSQTNPTPRLHKFTEPDQMGEAWSRRGREYGELFEATPDGTLVGGGDEELVDEHILKIGPQCEELVSQAIKLQDIDETLSALQRLTSAVQTLVARRITMLVIASLSTDTSLDFAEHLRSVGLVNVLSLVRLLRLVHAGRIDGTPGRLFGVRTPSSLLPIKGLDCLASALTTVVSDSLEAGSQLMQACSRDLLTAAVGGAKLLQRPRRRRRRRRNNGDDDSIDPNEKSDLAVLSNPNFAVTQSLVQTMAEAAGKAVFADDTGVLLMTDALAACLFSSKLESQYRFWALEQLLKVFATSSQREGVTQPHPEYLVLPSHTSELVGHTGQAMACCDGGKSNKILSIGEDNALLVWSEDRGLNNPQVFPFPKLTQGSGYLLPVLTQSSNAMCAAGAVNDTLCIWRVKDGITVTETFPELITALQWKPGQRDSETPLLVVGLLGGDLVMVEIMGARVNMSPSLQLTRLEHFGRGAISAMEWSSAGSRFACCSPSGTIQVYSGSNREYVPSIRISELQVTSLCWSPDERMLTTLEPEGDVKLWDVGGELPRVVHSMGPYTVVAWQPQAGNIGTMLLAGGCLNGSINLWLVDYLSQIEPPLEEGVEEEKWGLKLSMVATLTGHQAPLTSLQFTHYTASLLASGCRGGSVSIWDVQLFREMKRVSQSVGEVLNLTWTSSGLAVCYTNSNTVYLIPPGVSEYAGERCLLNCYPVLHSHGISDLTKAPCLSALLKNLHHILLDQYTYEEKEVRSSQQIVFSEYLQMLTALTVGLGLHSVLISPPHPPHFTSPPPAQEWEWLNQFSQAIKMSESLMKRTPLTDDIQVPESNMTDPLTKEEEAFRRDTSVWTLTMDTQILEWVTQQAEDWWTSQRSHVYVWGKGHWNVIGHSGRERILPTLLDEWKDVRMVTAGSYCTYAVKFDGTVASVGEGSYGRLGHSHSDNARLLNNVESLQGIHIVEVVAGVRVTTATEEGFAIALTNTGDVYSWGQSYRGRLGHPTADNQRTPKLVEALAGKDCKQVWTCDYHTAVLASTGHLYTCGAKENGKLGHGNQGASGNIGRITRITKFLDCDEQTDMDVKIGYVALGQSFSIAISEDMRQVFGCGKADHGVLGQRNISGDHHIFFYLPHLSVYGPFKKAAAGYRATILLNTRGQVILMGKFYDNAGISEPEVVQFPSNERVVDIQTGSGYILALTESGSVYTWGKNSTTSYELGYELASNQTSPKRVDTLYGRKIRQISAGVRHCLALDTPPPARGDVMFAVPLSVPARYPALRDLPCKAIHARLMLLNHFAKLMVASWKLFSIQNIKGESTRFNINPLLDSNIRALISQVYVEGMMAGIMSRTMNSKTHGPTISVQRITADERVSKAVFPQIAQQILQKPVVDLRSSSRAWKVNLIGEGADDAGGVFDETMAQMCEVRQSSVS
ncbi:Probable E3 ubiquitin-protein ligase HERC1 [Geodia barretti]|uniref:Probable E3 ubiquitin-protein ligase HERC1 n=1 Tax=Geodia barretti TaxID=519541 RepID=A0AA35S3A4_GEOBA|nr:Probable E3 ubiquitin-protein ligase HERC1 [Geodia barretti]